MGDMYNFLLEIELVCIQKPKGQVVVHPGGHASLVELKGKEQSNPKAMKVANQLPWNR